MNVFENTHVFRWLLRGTSRTLSDEARLRAHLAPIVLRFGEASVRADRILDCRACRVDRTAAQAAAPSLTKLADP
jgi:hypothetical protein